MAHMLHQADEETDIAGYQAYLRGQTDDDLLDIAGHLDADRYPARRDFVLREAHRRQILSSPVYTSEEYFVRGLSVAALFLAAATLALTLLLNPIEAAGPSWPTAEMMPDGTPMTEVIRLFSVAILRGLFVWGIRFGPWPLLLFWLGGWVAARASRVWKRRARADVWRLAAAAWLALIAAVTFALGPASAVPALFGWDR